MTAVLTRRGAGWPPFFFYLISVIVLSAACILASSSCKASLTPWFEAVLIARLSEAILVSKAGATKSFGSSMRVAISYPPERG